MTEATLDAAPAAAPAPRRPGAGVIHDLGYARYAGERRSPSTLWLVIMRHQLAQTWKTWWRWKLWAIGAVLTTVGIGIIIYLSQNEMFEGLRKNGEVVRVIDGLIPYSFTFFRWCAFGMTMTVASTGIARDRETGAFGFYFCRPVRARDYVLGKVAGMALAMASLLVVGPLLLAGFRIGLASDTDEVMRLLPWLARVLVVGVLASLIYAILPMALSALLGRRWLALGLWAGYWVVGTGVFAVIGYFSWKPLISLDPGAALSSLAYGLWDLSVEDDKIQVTVTVALVSLIVHVVGGAALLYWRVRREAVGAVGAGS